MTTASFKTRIAKAAVKRGPIILACDYPPGTRAGELSVQKTIKSTKDHICAIKVNFHLLLRMGPSNIRAINSSAHEIGAVSIADIKLNDIGNTNDVTLDCLNRMDFDAVIANPIMGKKALALLVSHAHHHHMGVISLCHMSAPEAKESYETPVRDGGHLYKLFLEWALHAKVDGIVVGATYPEIITECRGAMPDIAIYSPGIGVQGGNRNKAFDAGTTYPIVGRSVISADDPGRAAGLILGR